MARQPGAHTRTDTAQMDPRARLGRVLRHIISQHPDPTATPTAITSADEATRGPMAEAAQRLRGKVCVVVGASSQVREDISIGKATAIQFAR